MKLITLEQAKFHERIDTDDQDSDVTLYANAAESSAEQFLNRVIYVDQASKDAAGDDDGIVVNDQIRAAVLLIFGNLYANREDSVLGKTVASLPQGSIFLLWPFRIGLGV